MPPAPAPPTASRGPLRVVVIACVAVGLVLGLALLAAAFVTVTAVTTDSVERRARTFPHVERLRIHPGSGDVTVVGERRDDIRVDMRIHGNAWRHDVDPVVRLRRGGLLQLDGDCSVWTFLGAGECGTSFTVRIPATTPVRVVDSGSGDVRLQALTGPLDVSTGSGEVNVEGYRGPRASVWVGSGDVDLQALRAPRDVRVQAGSGDVELAVPDVRYRVVVDTGSGDEDVQVRDDPRATRAINVRTGSGDVQVYGVGTAR